MSGADTFNIAGDARKASSTVALKTITSLSALSPPAVEAGEGADSVYVQNLVKSTVKVRLVMTSSVLLVQSPQDFFTAMLAQIPSISQELLPAQVSTAVPAMTH